jgi:hypothetical protein
MVASAVNDRCWTQDILAPLIILVLMQFLELHNHIQQVQLSPQIEDRFVWRWSPSGNYSTRSAYSALFLGQTVVEGARQLWKVHAPNKVHFFMWVVLMGKCWTSARR